MPEFNSMLEFCCKANVLDKKVDLIYNQTNSWMRGGQGERGEVSYTLTPPEFKSLYYFCHLNVVLRVNFPHNYQ